MKRPSLRRYLWPKLGTQVIGLVLLVVLLTGGLISWLVTWESRDTLRESILSHNASTAAAVASLAEQFVDVAKASLDHLATGPVFNTAIIEGDVDEAEYHMQLLVALGDRFDNVSVYTPEGIGWASGLGSSWKDRGKSIADREWFQQPVTTEQPYLGLAIISETTGKETVPYAIPLFENGTISAVLVGDISLNRLSDKLVLASAHESNGLHLVDKRDGSIIATSDSDLLMKPITTLSDELAVVQSSPEGTLGIRDTKDRDLLIAFTQVNGCPWSLIVEEPQQIAFAPAYTATKRTLAIVTSVLVIALLLSLLLTRRITAPLRALLAGTEEIGSGNLDLKLGTTRRDEFGTLSNAFDRMTAELKETLVSRDELAAEVKERKHAEQALHKTADRLQAILEAIPDILVEVDEHNAYKWANETGFKFFGDDMVGKEASYYFEGAQDTYDIVDPHFEDSEDLVYVESWHRRKDGEKRLLAWLCRSLHDESGRTTGALSSAIDITERRLAEEELRKNEEMLRHSQKMEAVGRLAGGIAHDFNNLLTAIIGYCDMILLTEEGKAEALHADLLEIKAAAERAASLTSQILAFSRRQTLQPSTISLNDVVRGMELLLRRTLGERIELFVRLNPSLALSSLDVGQIEQVVMNLAVNASDAMPTGGLLTIATDNVELDTGYCGTHTEVQPGDYVMLSISDTGMGIDPDTLPLVFEPFYTTKGPGQGTGLGLATVYGIVSQSGGSISVRSEPGHGTTFNVYLPVKDQRSPTPQPPAPSSSHLSGGEKILVVEDEEPLRRLVERVLSGHGYTVVTAATAEQALESAESEEGSIDLLVADVVLRGGMQGYDLGELLLKRWPKLRVLYMSGYPRKAGVHIGCVRNGVDYLQKPFSPDTFVAKVRELLDREPS